jgi:hypothetical protein
MGGSSHASSRGQGKLPKEVKNCLDGFSEKMMKTRSFHQQLSSQRLIVPQAKVDTTRSIC